MLRRGLVSTELEYFCLKQPINLPHHFIQPKKVSRKEHLILVYLPLKIYRHKY